MSLPSKVKDNYGKGKEKKWDKGSEGLQGNCHLNKSDCFTHEPTAVVTDEHECFCS